LHHIADARVEIEEALSGTEDIAAPSATTRRATPFVYATWGLGVVAAILAVVAGVAVWTVGHAQPPRVARFELTTPSQAPLDLSSPWSEVAISPDGSRVVYATGDSPADSRLYLRQSGDVEITTIRGSERASNPFFLPDGQRVGFIDTIENSLKQVSVFGGPATTIASVGRPIGGASWGPDDTIVYGDVSGLWQVSASGGSPKKLTTPTPGGDVLGHVFPDILPNGKAVLFTMAGTTPATSRIAVASLESGAVTELITGGGQARYLSTGHILYGVDGALRAVAFDQDRLRVSGNPVPVVEGVLVKDSGAAMFAVAGNGSLVYVEDRTGTGSRRELTWVERDGRETHVAFADGSPGWPRLSPDGTRAAFVAGGAWVVDLSRGTPSRVTDVGPVTFVFWHPDGRRLLFAAPKDLGMQMYLQSADGTGKAEPFGFTSKIGIVSPEGWTADGRIVASYTTSTNQFDIGILPLSGDAIQPFLNSQSSEDSLTISRDGRWIAYESNRTGQYEVYVERFPEGGDRRAISAPIGGEDPVWSHSGTELFYRRLKDRAMMVVPVTTGAAFTSGPAQMLFQGNYYDTGGRQYDVDREGRRFLLFKNVSRSSDSAPPRLILVQNFFEELKRLVPTN
jgi:serine/threonine-protein kinase